MPRETNYKLGDHGETPIEVVGWIIKEIKGFEAPARFGALEVEAYDRAIDEVVLYLEKLKK